MIMNANELTPECIADIDFLYGMIYDMKWHNHTVGYKSRYPMTETSGKSFQKRIMEVFIAKYQSFFNDLNEAKLFYEKLYSLVDKVRDKKFLEACACRAYFDIVNQTNYNWMDLVGKMSRERKYYGDWAFYHTQQEQEEYKDTLYFGFLYALNQ